MNLPIVEQIDEHSEAQSPKKNNSTKDLTPDGFTKLEVKPSLEFQKLMNSIGRRTRARRGSKKSSNKSSSRGKLPTKPP